MPATPSEANRKFGSSCFLVLAVAGGEAAEVPAIKTSASFGGRKLKKNLLFENFTLVPIKIGLKKKKILMNPRRPFHNLPFERRARFNLWDIIHPERRRKEEEEL